MVQSLIKPTAVNYRFKGRAKGTTFYKRLINSNLQKLVPLISEKTAFSGNPRRRHFREIREDGVYRKREATRKVTKAATHARAIVYTAVMIAHFQPPLSFLMATKVAMQGKYRRINTI